MEIKISEIRDNGGTIRKVYANLTPGTKLRAISTVTSKGDIGDSGLTYDYEAFIPGEEYEVYSNYMWHGVLISYVLDEDNTLHFATPDLFEVLK